MTKQTKHSETGRRPLQGPDVFPKEMHAASCKCRLCKPGGGPGGNLAKVEPTTAPHEGNQATLNNGCVCDSGCESCDRLAAEVIALREALAALADKVKGE